MSRILCAGLVTVDLVYRVGNFRGRTKNAVSIAARGPAASAAALGASVTLVTAVGVPGGGLPDADLTLVDGHHPRLAVAAARRARRLLGDAGSRRPVLPTPPPADPAPCSERSDLADGIAFAIRVAGVRVTHAGPRDWLAALPG